MSPDRSGSRWPNNPARDLRAFDQRIELGPRNRGGGGPIAQPAVRAPHQVLPADEVCITHEALRHELGMFDEVGAMPDHTGDQDNIVRQAKILEHLPLMLVTGVCSLDRELARVHAEQDVDDLLERKIELVWSMVAAPADMNANLLFGNAAQRMIQRIDSQHRVFAIVRNAHIGIHLPAVGEIGIIDLQHETSI
jgi:hypothetical protein